MKCFNCKEKETARDGSFNSDYWFCSDDCRKKYVQAHPNDDWFRNQDEIREQKQTEKHYCDKCNRLMQEFWDFSTGQQSFKCKCGEIQ